MIAIDGKCYRAMADGAVEEAGDDRTKGGHVYELKMTKGNVRLAKKNCIEEHS